MGDENFFKPIFEFRSEHVYFFLIHDNQYYLMDASRRVKVLAMDPVKDKLYLKQTLDLHPEDKERLDQVDFDEFMISNGVLHWNDLMFFLIETKARENPTWIG